MIACVIDDAYASGYHGGMSKQTVSSPTTQKTVPPKKKRWIRWVVVTVVIAVPFLLSLGAAGYYYARYQDLNKMSADQFSQRENEETIRAVARLYSLPKDEQPSIAAIKDKDAVKQQYPFLSQAENDDVLLLYKTAQLAILYRPSTGQLVKVGALNIQNTAKVKVIGTAAERQTAVKTLNDAKLAASDGGDAKTTPVGVTVVDLTGKNAALTAQVATALKGQVSALPAGEDKPSDADVLVIVGTTASDATNVAP